MLTDPVLIVGAGPTGLTAALELARLGVAVRVVDKREAPADTSRAIGIQARTLELMERRGLADEMVRLGNQGRYGSVYGGGTRVFRLDFAHVASRYGFLLFLSQAETERILRDALAAAGVMPEWGTEMVGFSQDPGPHGPPAKAILSKGGSLEETRAPWLISAEGSHSVVRTTLDLRFEGRTLDETYALGDIRIDGGLADTDFHIFSSEHGFMGLFPMGQDHFRLIASNPPGRPDKDTAPSLEQLQEIYDGRSPIPARFHDMVWSSWFRINSRMVPRLRIGRLLLGGDSAHIHSPAGAQGMNTGIQDMINLGWKLALVIGGKAPQSLLDTYEQDRLPVMHDVLSKTESLTGIIGTESHLVRTLFNHLGPWVGRASMVQENSTGGMAQVALGYRDSPLSDNHAHAGDLRAGDRVPELRVGAAGDAATRLHTLLDPSGFVLLVAHGDTGGAVGAELREAAGAASVPIAIVELVPPSGEAGLAAYRHELGLSSSVFLVRPDGYVAVAAGSHAAAAAIEAFVRKWLVVDHGTAE